ncbi:MAG: alpha-L-fucosidase [Candidatus Bathyarchaeota archaeon B26-2]|nr:MAG: alpha-L-fucosidase [Candidatus Bathyarchaeota archaeon B26-2]
MSREWFNQARFGMFIHWGVYSILARGEWVRLIERIPSSEYEALAWKFKPKNYRPEEWVELAQDAGMKYMVLTTRHHDGFSLFDSEVSDFTAPKTGAKRDLVAEYVEACKERDMKVGFYYSLLDWRYPAYFKGPKADPEGWNEFLEYVHTQVKELCTNYGKIDVLWYDGGWPWTAEDWRSAELNAMVRRLQPGILINNRSKLPEDFDTPEQRIGPPSDPNRMWETCMTMNDNWGYSAGDRNWKTVRQLIQNLVRCASGAGNYLLNVGPRADGTIPEPSVKRLRRIGAWMRVNGESIYGSERCPFRGGMVGLTTAKGNTAYLHVFRWPGREITVAYVKNKVLSARILATGQEVEVTQKGDRVFLRGLPKRPPDPYDTVIAMELDGKPEAYPFGTYVP